MPYDFYRTYDVETKLVGWANTAVVLEQDTPKYLYKYTNRAFAESLVSRGSLRLGTIHDYRDGEQHCEGKHDPAEGAVTFTGELKNGEKLALQIASRDSWIYCLSENCEPQLAKQFDPTYDCIVRIHAREFFNSLSRHLSACADVAALRKVQYLKKDELDVGVWPCEFTGRPLEPLASAIKPAPFEAQSEWRMVFEPRINFIDRPRSPYRHTPFNTGAAPQFGLQVGMTPKLPSVAPKVLDQVPSLIGLCEIVWDNRQC